MHISVNVIRRPRHSHMQSSAVGAHMYAQHGTIFSVGRVGGVDWQNIMRTDDFPEDVLSPLSNGFANLASFVKCKERVTGTSRPPRLSSEANAQGK